MAILRMVELNADTPCFLVESYYANEIAANYVGRKHPNKACREELRIFFKNVCTMLCYLLSMVEMYMSL